MNVLPACAPFVNHQTRRRARAPAEIQENLEDALVKEALASGQDLRLYSKQVEDELREVERESVADYLQEAGNMAQLHSHISNCDTILTTMETMLGEFQTDLGNISGEIHSLQEQSASMTIKIKNRKSVHGNLSSTVEGMSITDDFVDALANQPVTSDITKHLALLDQKLTYVASQPEGLASTVEAAATLHTLVGQVSARLLEFVSTILQSAKKSVHDLELQMDQLIEYNGVYTFLYKHNPQTARMIRTEYIETVGNIYLAHFRSYSAQLMKLQVEEVAGKGDVMGMEDGGSKKTSFMKISFKGKHTMKSKSSVFTLGSRVDILKELRSPIIDPQAVKDSGKGKGNKEQRFAYEDLFRSMQYAMMECCGREFVFCSQFFGRGHGDAKGGEDVYELFDAAMGKTNRLLLTHEETRIAKAYDSISLVLCARIIKKYQFIVGNNCLNNYYDRLLAVLWPRFEHIIDMNHASIAETDPSKLANVDTRPHYIVRRYAEYSGALLVLNDESKFGEVLTALERLRSEVSNFILKMAAEFLNRREQLIFLINNYDMMISVYSQQTQTTSREADEFRGLLEARMKEFAEEELMNFFSGIITFVKEVDGALRQNADPSGISVDEERVLALTHGFARDWKTNISEMDSNVMRCFTNFKNGTAILQTALTQLVVVYERFSTILKQAPFKRPGGWMDLINMHHVTVEVKKHKTVF